MKCDITDREKLIDDYIHGNLTVQEMESFDKHCFECQICFSELHMREEMTELIKEKGHVLFADYLKKKSTHPFSLRNLFKPFIRFLTLPQHRWAYATAGMVIAIFLILIQLNKPHMDTGTYFETLPYYEEMLSDVTRSESITVLSPAIGEEVQGKINFQWEGFEEEPVYLKILNNQGQEIFISKTDKNQLQFTKKLNPGLYYWKLESEEELLYLGKFLVMKSGN